MKRKKRMWGRLLFLTAFLGALIVCLDAYLCGLPPKAAGREEPGAEGRESAAGQERAPAPQAGIRAMDDELARAMDFGRGGFAAVLSWARENDKEPGEAMAVWMAALRYDLGGVTAEGLSRPYYERLREEIRSAEGGSQGSLAYEEAKRIYSGLAEDLQVFPVLQNEDPSCAFVTFQNDWGNPRTFGGDRRHEGCDLMGDEYRDGTYPVVSMTDGVVEQLGWLKLGGWRVGIRSDNGIYYYYAHLASYADGLLKGDRVEAGDLLGYMGSTGYSTVEGTSGKFAVHLHIGIYVGTDGQEELSVNPYYLMRYLENGHVKMAAFPFEKP